MVMKKIFCIAITALTLCFALYGCGQDNDDSADHVTGTITIFSGGKTYAPLENWIYSMEKNGPAADGARKQPREVSTELTAIPYEDDFQIIIDGERLGEPSFTLFNEKFEEEYYRQPNFVAPKNKGEYILFVDLSWGNDESYSGYQYCFKLELSSDSEATSRIIDGNNAEATLNFSSEYFAEIIRKPDTITCYVNGIKKTIELTQQVNEIFELSQAALSERIGQYGLAYEESDIMNAKEKGTVLEFLYETSISAEWKYKPDFSVNYKYSSVTIVIDGGGSSLRKMVIVGSGTPTPIGDFIVSDDLLQIIRDITAESQNPSIPNNSTENHIAKEPQLREEIEDMPLDDNSAHLHPDSPPPPKTQVHQSSAESNSGSGKTQDEPYEGTAD